MIGLLCGNNGGLWRSLCELPVPTKNLLDPLFGFLSRRKESVVKEFFIYTDKIIRHIYTPIHPITIRGDVICVTYQAFACIWAHFGICNTPKHAALLEAVERTKGKSLHIRRNAYKAEVYSLDDYIADNADVIFPFDANNPPNVFLSEDELKSLLPKS